MRAREIVLVAVGVFTPVGILAVNGAAFVMQHLEQFRLVLAIAALVSSVLLNGLAAFSAIRFSQRNAPLLYKEYERVAWVTAVLIVVGSSVLAAWFTYVGMEDRGRLPDRNSILGATFALLTPFLITYIDRRFIRRREVAAETAEEQEQEQRRPPARRPAPPARSRPGTRTR